jgi:hypothetical protein
MILGAGGIGVSATNLLWIGNLMGDDEPIALCWPIGRLSDVRVKCLSDEPPMLLLTVDGQMFIQMQSSTEVAADRLSAICEQVKTLMKPPPRRDFVNSAAMDLIEKRKS